MNNAIVQGSIRALAQQSGKSLAETFMSCDIVVIVDTSGSMGDEDAPGGKSRYKAACDELASLQQHLPGKVAVIAFSSQVQFCPAGVPVDMGCGTDMVAALRFVHPADAVEGMRFFLISDGEPANEAETLKEARRFRNKISTIYVGPESHPVGRDFLQRLAAATGGQMVTADRVKELSATIEKLLLRG